MTANPPKPFHQRYQVGEPIRENGLGQVVRGLDTETQTPVAILKLHVWINDLRAEALTRLQEAVLASRTLHHAAIQTVLADSFTDNRLADEPFMIALNWLEGTPLSQLTPVDLKALSVAQKASIGQTLASALDYLLRQTRQPNLAWLRPALSADKIFLQPATQQPILVDLGWAALLRPVSATPGPLLDAPTLVRQVGWLVLTLLQNDLSVYREVLPAQAEIDAALARQRQTAAGDSTTQSRTLAEILQDALAASPGMHEPRELAQRLQQVAGTSGGTTAAVPSTVLPIRLGPMSTQSLPAVVDPVSTTAPTASSTTAPSAPTRPEAPPTVAAERAHLLFYADPDKPDPTAPPYPITTSLTTVGADGDLIKIENLAERRLCIFYDEKRGVAERYTVTDTGNGVHQQSHYARLNDVPLSPIFAALLRDGDEIKLAGYRFVFKRRLATAIGKAATQQKVLQITQRRLEGEPGARLSIPITIENPTNEVDRFWVMLDGQPTHWRVDYPEAQQLFHDDPPAPMLIGVTLPPREQSTARTYDVILRLISVNLQAQVAATRLTITVLPVVEYTGGLLPEILRTGSAGKVYIENHSNLLRPFKLIWRDRNNELLFEPAETTLTVRAGEDEEVNFRAYVRTWRWLGREKSHNYSVLVAPQGGQPQTYTGQVRSRALIPPWFLPIIGLLVMALFLLVALVLKADFIERRTEPATPIAGQPFTLHWIPLHSCFYSVYQDKQARTWLAWHEPQGKYEVRAAQAVEGSEFQVRIRNCLLLGEKEWTVTVGPAPTGTPTPPVAPVIEQFVMSIENLERLEAGDLPQALAFTPTPTSTPDFLTPSSLPRTLLLGQTGELCFHWQVKGEVASLSINPLVGPLKEPQGKVCKPIAQTFNRAEQLAFSLQADYGDQQSVFSPELHVNVVTPECYLNTDQSIAVNIREGPGRNFPERGYLQGAGRVMVKMRPFYPREQEANAELWMQVLLPGDPRAAWVAYNYLACNGDVLALPASGEIPLTPTPTPTTTSTPTATPVPVLEPQVSIVPEVINLGGCALIKWDIQQVLQVYLNGEGVIGVSEREDCPKKAERLTYTWRIVKTDGSSVEIKRTLLVNPGGGELPPPE